MVTTSLHDMRVWGVYVRGQVLSMYNVSFEQGIYVGLPQSAGGAETLRERRAARERMDVSRIGKRNIVDFAARREELR